MPQQQSQPVILIAPEPVSRKLRPVIESRVDEPLETFRRSDEKPAMLQWISRRESRGRSVQLQPDWDLVKTPNRTIDTRGSQSVLIDDFPGEGLFVVQFRGPARSEWFESMTECAVRFVGYVPHNAALVHATRESLGRFIVSEGHNLQYIGVFDDTMKHQPVHLFSSAMDTVNRIQLADVPRSSETIERLKAGYAAEEIVRYGGYVLLEAYLEPSGVAIILREASVVAVEERGEDRLSGEREALGLANQGTTGNTYRNWLINTGVHDTSTYKIAVADTGLSSGKGTTLHSDFSGKSITWYSYDGSSGTGSGYDWDGHGTAVAGMALGDPQGSGLQDGSSFWYGLGVAPKTQIVVQKILSSSGILGSMSTWLADATSAGASVQTQSRNVYASNWTGVYSAEARRVRIPRLRSRSGP